MTDNPSAVLTAHEVLHHAFAGKFSVAVGEEHLGRTIDFVGVGTYDETGSPVFRINTEDIRHGSIAILPAAHTNVLEFMIPSLLRQRVTAIFLVGASSNDRIPPTTIDLARSTKLLLVFVEHPNVIEAFKVVWEFFIAEERIDRDLPTVLASSARYSEEPQQLLNLLSARLKANISLTSTSREDSLYEAEFESALTSSTLGSESVDLFTINGELFRLEATWPHVVSHRIRKLFELYAQYAVLCLRPWVLRKQEELRKDQARKIDILNALAVVEDATAQDMLSVQAHEFGWKVQAWHVAAWGNIAHAELAEEATQIFCQTVGAIRSHGDWVITQEGELCMMVAIDHDLGEPDMESEFNRLVEKFGALHYLSHLGISLPHFGAQGLGRSVTEARLLHAYSKSHAGQHEVQLQKHKVDDPLLAHLLAGPAAHKQAETKLDILVKHPNADLLRTLDTYLQFESNLTMTSKALHIHRNTVSQRLKTIERLLSISLDDYKEKLALRCALEIIR